MNAINVSPPSHDAPVHSFILFYVLFYAQISTTAL